jgi:UDP-N-acetylmuramoyl-tripeptide--D-alanyl-D-alanine ligase
MPHTLNDIYQAFLKHPVISTDSRRIAAGSIFFALKGEQFNGNDYAAGALDQGAAFAVVDEPRQLPADRHFLVEDVLSTLQELALHHRKTLDIPVIAITGTNGKTTTKELVAAVLARKFTVVATKGNLNNHIGVPLTLLTLTRDTGIAVIEMGANHPGEIAFLCNIARPTHGLITNIGKAHLEGFGGFEGVVRTKTELYDFLKAGGGQLFVHKDDKLLMDHAGECATTTYGSPLADLAAVNVSADPFVTLDLLFRDGSSLPLKTNLYGLYNAPNILAAASVGQYFGIGGDEIRIALEAYRPVNNRSQVTRTDRNLLIMDAYNANPTSMEAALKTFAAASYPEKTVLLGDMLELGTESDNEHLHILSLVAELGFGQVYLVGPDFTRLNTRREFTCFHDSELARMWFMHHPLNNQTILVKGSRGIRLETIVDQF